MSTSISAALKKWWTTSEGFSRVWDSTANRCSTRNTTDATRHSDSRGCVYLRGRGAGDGADHACPAQGFRLSGDRLHRDSGFAAGDVSDPDRHAAEIARSVFQKAEETT